MNVAMISSLTLPRLSFNISDAPDADNSTGRGSMEDAVTAAPGLAGAGAESCATKIGAIWPHNAITANAIIELERIRLFINWVLS